MTCLVRKATLGQLTLPCDVEGAERGLLVVSGPATHLKREGIERGRRWLEKETRSMEVRSGDYPISGADHVAGLVLLSGVHRVPRVDELKQVAVETRNNIDQRDAEHDEALEGLY